ncbi:MAG TPA: SulP family inorganic anion transporter [Bryobacteraceae bacterium]|nr:SulP family inorganic anion transporter [Bryobacteraceae bacterium]
MLRHARRYNWRLFAGDCFGGVIAALIALPYGLAMATAMGLPPMLGVLTSIITSPVTVLLGRNPLLIGGTSSVTIFFIAAAVRQQGISGAAKVSVVASVFMMAFCVLRLGRYISKVPHTVVTGFSCGIGGIMVISQLHLILGIAKSTGESPILQMLDILGRTPGARWQPMVLAALVMLTAAVASRFSKLVPAPLLGVFVAYASVKLFSFHEAEVGSLPLTMPPLASFTWSATDAYTVLSAAFGLAVVSSINLLLTSRVVEHFRGRHHFLKRSDADRELGAYGIANICAGLFGAPLSVGIPARSVAAIRCGATTRLSNLMHAGFLCAFLWFGAGFVAHVPLAALAGVTAWMGFNLLDWSTWRRLHRMRWIDSASFLVTTAGVLAVSNAIYAVAAGCALYGGHYLYGKFFPTAHIASEVPAQIAD